METSKCVKITFIIRNNINAGFFLQIYQHLSSQTFCATKKLTLQHLTGMSHFSAMLKYLAFQQAVKKQGVKADDYKNGK